MNNEPPTSVRFYVAKGRWIDVAFERETSAVLVRSNHPIFCHPGSNSKEVKITSMPEEWTFRPGEGDEPGR